MASNKGSVGTVPARAPVKIALASLGVGLGWAAWHAPQNVTHVGLTASCLVWLVDSATAALVTLSILEVLAAVLGSVLRAVQTRLQSVRH